MEQRFKDKLEIEIITLEDIPLSNTGTARCQGDLRKVLNGPGVVTLNLPGNLVLISNVDEKFNDQGEFIDERTIERMESVIDNFIDWAKKMNS